MRNEMLAIDRQAEKIRRRDRLIHQLFLLIIALASTVIILAVMIFAMTRTAAADSICLSKKEARQLWPKRHIYWYSKDHCWSNRRGPPRNLKLDLIPNKNATTIEASFAKILPAPIYDQLPRSRPQIMQPDPPDDCCWPPLDHLLTEEKEMPLRLLADKLNQNVTKPRER
jgi:hypothetical protein